MDHQSQNMHVGARLPRLRAQNVHEQRQVDDHQTQNVHVGKQLKLLRAQNVHEQRQVEDLQTQNMHVGKQLELLRAQNVHEQRQVGGRLPDTGCACVSPTAVVNAHVCAWMCAE